MHYTGMVKNSTSEHPRRLQGRLPALQVLAACPDLLLTPHIAGRSPESMQAMVDRVLRNIDNHLSGHGVITPMPSP